MSSPRQPMLNQLGNVYAHYDTILRLTLSKPGAILHCVYALKAINAMHQSCPAEHLTPTDDERLHYQRKAGAGAEPSDYYLLKVRPRAKGGFETIGHGQAAESRRAHGVRGHFKYYDPERPLFGRAG